MYVCRLDSGDSGASNLRLPSYWSHVALLVLGHDHEIRGKGGNGGTVRLLHMAEDYAYRIRTIIQSMQFVWGFDVCMCDKCMYVCVRWYTKCSVSSQKSPSCWTGTARCARTTRDACSFPPTPPSSKCLPMLTFIHTFIHSYMETYGFFCTIRSP